MTHNDLTFKQCNEQELIPFELLLLADPSKKLIDEYLKTSKIFVVEKNEKVIGTVVLQIISEILCEIKNVAVLPEFQGQGIGKYLIENITLVARQSNFRTIQIGTANSSIGQLYLYQKLGFELSEIRKNFFIEHYNELITENGIQAKHLLMLTRVV